MNDDQACRSCGTTFIYRSGGRTYSREIAVIESGVYDGVLYWQCPFCKTIRHRWRAGSPLRAQADAMLKKRSASLAT